LIWLRPNTLRGHRQACPLGLTPPLRGSSRFCRLSQGCGRRGDLALGYFRPAPPGLVLPTQVEARGGKVWRSAASAVFGHVFLFSRFLDLHVAELFGVKDLSTLQALNELGIFVPGNDSHSGMFAGGRHSGLG